MPQLAARHQVRLQALIAEKLIEQIIAEKTKNEELKRKLNIERKSSNHKICVIEKDS